MADEQVVDTVSVEPEVKSFSQMTEDEKLALPESELLKYLDGQETSENEPEAEKMVEDEQPVEQEKELTVEEEFERMSKLSDEDFLKEPKNKKGIFYEMKKERARRQEIQAELDKEREIRKAQVEIMDKMRVSKENPQDSRTEEQKVKEIISAKAAKYEEEYGEEYRLSFKDLEALEEARKFDSKNFEEKRKIEDANKQRETVTKTMHESIIRSQKQLSESGIDDFDYVWKEFIEPIVNPDIARDKEDAIHYAQLLARKTLNGENAMEYAYKHIAKLHPDGEKYFEEKKQKSKNKELAEEAKKTTTKTSSHVATKASSGKELVTIAKFNANFDYWNSKLTPEQFNRVVSGEEVYI